MSWDLFVQDLPPGIRSVAEIPDDFEPAGLRLERSTLIDRVQAAFPTADSSDPAWLVANGASWSIEFNLGGDESVRSFVLHVRGDRPPIAQIQELLSGLGLRAIDPRAGSGLFEQASGD